MSISAWDVSDVLYLDFVLFPCMVSVLETFSLTNLPRDPQQACKSSASSR